MTERLIKLSVWFRRGGSLRFRNWSFGLLLQLAESAVKALRK